MDKLSTNHTVVCVGTQGMTPSIGQVLVDKYCVERVLGSGGMGVVVLASHLELRQRVALKLLRPELCESAELLARFMQEGRTAAKLRSEHVCKVLDVGRLATGEAFLVMEYMQGHDLAMEVSSRGPLEVSLAVDYVLQACEALAEAHVLGIVHRDLKPANLFLANNAYGDRSVKVLDFGISKIRSEADLAVSSPALTGSHTIMGSPSYMSPEQMRAARDVDCRSDIWSLGTILYELLTSQVAFGGTTLAVVCASVLGEKQAPMSDFRSDLSEQLEQVVARCLEKDASRRYPNVPALAVELLKFASGAGHGILARTARLIAERAPDQSQLLVAAAGAQGVIPGSSCGPVAPNTLPMPQPEPVAELADPYATTQSLRAAPSTSVVWSGTDLGLRVASKPKRPYRWWVTAGGLGIVAFVLWWLRAHAFSAPATVASGLSTSSPWMSSVAEVGHQVPETPSEVPPPSDTVDARNTFPAKAPVVQIKPHSEAINTSARRSVGTGTTPATSAATTNIQKPEPVRSEPAQLERPSPPMAHSSKITDYGGRE